MPNENTSLKNVTQGGDSNTTHEMVIGKLNTYQRTFLIVAGSLLALLVLIAVVDTSGGQHLQSSTVEIFEGAVALADYEVDSVNLGLTKDIFGVAANSETDKGGCAFGTTSATSCTCCYFGGNNYCYCPGNPPCWGAFGLCCATHSCTSF